MSNLKHHTLDPESKSSVKRVAYDPDTQKLYMDFGGKAYRYHAVPPHHFDNIQSAKNRTEAIGDEKPGSEGSYIQTHIIGKRGQEPPYAFDRPGEWDHTGIFPVTD